MFRPGCFLPYSRQFLREKQAGRRAGVGRARSDAPSGVRRAPHSRSVGRRARSDAPYLLGRKFHRLGRRRLRSAGFQPAVSRVSNPPARSTIRTPCRLEVGDTAGWKPALRRLRAHHDRPGYEISALGRARSDAPYLLCHFPERAGGNCEPFSLTPALIIAHKSGVMFCQSQRDCII